MQGRQGLAGLPEKMEEDPDTAVVQIDSVEGKKGGAVLLTVHFVKPEFMLAFYREHNDSRSVTDIFNALYELLGLADFRKIFPLLLADNGSEFSNPSSIELTEEGDNEQYHWNSSGRRKVLLTVHVRS